MKSFQPRMKAKSPAATSPWSGEREDHRVEDAPRTCAVDARRLDEVVGEGVEEALQHPDAQRKGEGRERQDQRQVGVQQPELREHQIQGDEQERCGNIWLNSMKYISDLRPPKRYFENAYPMYIETITDSISRDHRRR